MGEGQRGAQQVADSVVVVFVLLDGLDAEAVFGQHRLVAGGVARGREELKIAVATSEQEAKPVGWKAEDTQKRQLEVGRV